MDANSVMPLLYWVEKNSSCNEKEKILAAYIDDPLFREVMRWKTTRYGLPAGAAAPLPLQGR